MTSRATVTPDEWAEFDERGCVVLRGAIAPEALAALRGRIDEIMLGTADVDFGKLMMQLDSPDGQYGNMGEQTMGHKGATLGYRKIQNLDQDRVWMDYMRAPLFDDACKRVYGAGTAISSFRCMFFNKPARRPGSAIGGTTLPWHQDRWRHLTADPLLTVYSALDDATAETGCVFVVPGSHKLGVQNPEHHSGFLTDEQVAAACGEEKQAQLELRAGDVALLHNWTIHKSGTNSTDNSRRAYSVNYMPATTQAYCHEYEIGKNEKVDLKQGGQEMGKGSALSEGGLYFPVIFPREE